MSAVPAAAAAFADAVRERYDSGSQVQVSDSFGELVVDVPPDAWVETLSFARSRGFEFFDWLTGVDDPPDDFQVVAHVFDPVAMAHLLVRTGCRGPILACPP